jgi:hypothetical protein
MPAMTFRSGAVATALLGATGCAVSVEPSGTITKVSPTVAFYDVAIEMTIDGGPFRAAYEIDTGNGASAVAADAFSVQLRRTGADDDAVATPIAATSVAWVNEGRLVAQLPAGIPIGSYDLELRDPRGSVTPFASAFTSEGADVEAPGVKLTHPTGGILLGAGTTQNFRFESNDGLGWIGGMHWRAWTDSSATVTVAEDDCVIPPQSHGTPCLPTVNLPPTTAPSDLIHLQMSVVDRAQPRPHQAIQEVSFPFAPRPQATSCSPMSGGAAGDITVTITGSDFVEALSDLPLTGTQILLRDDLGDTLLPQRAPSGATVLSALLPPHRAGPVSLVVRNDSLEETACTFTFLPAPVVRRVTPNVGPSAGGTRVTINGGHFAPGAKVLLVGQVDGQLLCPVRVSDSRMEGVMPAGTGAVQFIVDAGLVGQSLPFAGFVYDEAAPPPSAGPPPCTTGSSP